MRRVLSAAITAATCVATFLAAAAGPAAADPASASSAAAYGLSATGTLPISPTVTTAATQPPDQDAPVSQLLGVPLGGLAIAGAVGVVANAHQADNITPELTSVPATAGTSSPVTLVGDNSRGLAKTTGLGVAISGAVPGIDAATTTLLQQLGSLVSADAVTAEAVAKCVNNAPVFNTGFQVAGLGGLAGGIINPLLQPVLDLLIGPTGLLGANTPLSAIVSVSAGEVTQLADGIAINGLTVRIPVINETIVVSHAEAHMPQGCGVAVAKAPTGPGPVAPVGAQLAATGSDVPFLPLGMGMMAVALLSGTLVRRSRRQATPIQ
ncbi:MAG: hypothetical protein LC749_11895 [Actinobacteria bacterium]|nr:hypothetical protein [Actinomycetota bacterium]